jgi:hypothetical protein
MRRQRLTTAATSFALALALSACGGAGGGVNSTPSPPVGTPTPTPTPTPPASSLPPAPFGLTTTQQFATYGALSRSDAGEYNVDAASPSEIQFSWSAESKTYLVTLPGFDPARLELTFPGNNPLAFHGLDSSGKKLPLAFSVLGPKDGGLNFTYSSFVYYETYPPGATDPFVFGLFAYGLPTPAGAVPVSGTATYDATVRGFTTSGNGYDIRGTAQLQFDFGAGSLTGYMRPRLFNDWDGVDLALGQYDFTQTVYSPGSTTFGGRFVVPGSSADSSFHGQFTGPNATELISGWTAPYLDPFDNAWKTAGGMWIGKKN